MVLGFFFLMEGIFFPVSLFTTLYNNKLQGLFLKGRQVEMKSEQSA